MKVNVFVNKFSFSVVLFKGIDALDLVKIKLRGNWRPVFSRHELSLASIKNQLFVVNIKAYFVGSYNSLLSNNFNWVCKRLKEVGSIDQRSEKDKWKLFDVNFLVIDKLVVGPNNRFLFLEDFEAEVDGYYSEQSYYQERETATNGIFDGGV